MDDRYVFGWYEYDDRAVYFRYPADRSGDLHQDGKRVTVEVYVAGLWLLRDAVVVVTNGDYVVVPRKSSNK